MAYIGARPLIGNYQICDALTASATADYTLQVGSVNVSPQSANAMIVSLNGVIQGPGASRGFTVSGSTISFNSALTSSDVIDFIYIFGDVLDVGTPTDDTVTTAKIVDNAVTLAKLGDGTQGDVLYYGASGAPARLGFGTSGDFLKTQGTGANPVWASAAGGKVGQVVSTTVTAATATTTSATYEDIAGMTLDITPVATSSKILVIVNMYNSAGGASYAGHGQIVRDSTAICVGDAAGSRTRATFNLRAMHTDRPHVQAMNFLDSPSTTSATTYKIQWMETSGTTMYLNRSGDDVDNEHYGRFASTITAMEILA